eukprot:SAG25_NODE_395_length_8553_cov_4.407263_15_plen_38_part_00
MPNPLVDDPDDALVHDRCATGLRARREMMGLTTLGTS